MDIEAAGQIKENVNRVYIGRAVARGVGTGKVLTLFGTKRQFFQTRVANENLKSEIDRLRRALSTAGDELREIITRSEGQEGRAGIFESHLLFLQDSSLLRKIEKTITEEKVNCEWAIAEVVDEYVARYKSLTDKHLREKYIDLEDVGERLISALGGSRQSRLMLEPGTVVVATELNPSTLIEVAESKPAAIVTQNGGWTSHTFILARELGIPAVTGISKLLRRTETGDEILVDGYSGKIVVNPSQEIVSMNLKETIRKAGVQSNPTGLLTPIITTLDGVEIRICTNLDFTAAPSEINAAKLGIGLYRSEYLFNRYSGYPSEEVQLERYRHVLDLAEGANVKIRTFDLNANEVADREETRGKNPALGIRGIRLSLRDEDRFRTQMRALILAGAGRNLDIVLPMVSDLGEVDFAASILEDEFHKLNIDKSEIKRPGLGVMIEIPTAVFMIEEIMESVDFVSIGTNDLIQYMLAADRDNDDVADFFQTLHPAVSRAVRRILKAAAKHRKEAVVCGEMAGAPLYVPLLIGLGARTLSMNINSIRRISHIIANISEQECAAIADRVRSTRTSNEAETMLKRLYAEHWQHIPEFAIFNETDS